MPVLAASALRPFTVRAASSRRSVVRMPSDFSLVAAKEGRPSISEIGYVMIFRCENVFSSELIETGCPSDDRAHLILPDFVSAKPEKFTRDILDVADTQAQSHQPGTNGHQAAAHQL